MLRPQYAAPSLVHAPPGHPIVVGDCFTPYQSPMHALPALAPPHNGLDIPDHEEPPKPIDALRQAAGFTVRRFNGYYGKVTRLMRYNAKQLHLHFGWIPVLLPSVTVFKSLPHTFQVLLFIIWQQILGFFYTGKEPGMPDDWKLTFQRGFDNTFTLLAFLLGGFVTRHVLRWRAKRDHYQMILTKTRSIVTLAAAYFWDPTQRHQMGRYANLAFMLVAMEEQGEAEKAEEFLWGEGLLQGDEWLRMVPYDTNRYGTVYFWMATMAVRARRQGALEPEQFLRLDQTIAKAREVADNLAGTINNTMPLPYAQLVALFVKFVLFMAASLSGITLAEARVRQDALGAGGFGAEFWGWWAVDTFLLMVYLCGIQGLSDLHSVLTTPYGPRVIDLPHEKHSSELRAFTAGLMDPPGVLPFP